MRQIQIIHRDFSRTEHDDFVLNVQPLLQDSLNEAVPIYNIQDPDVLELTGQKADEILAWKVRQKYE